MLTCDRPLLHHSGAFPGAYPERQPSRNARLDRWWAGVFGPIVRQTHMRRLHVQRFVHRVAAHGHALHQVRTHEISALAYALRERLRRQGFDLEVSAKTFALIREVAGRSLGMRHVDVQVMGGWVLLQGMVAEMDTGEGKTLTATLPACTAALAGIPVHVITVNDYLARRDAEAMAPLFQALGLTVGVITQGMTPQERRAAYACDVTYCTNKEVAFDYLKDRLVLGRKTGRLHLQLECLGSDAARQRQFLLRGLAFAIVDEADSVLVDEARTPLILSSRTDTTLERGMYQEALTLAAQLTLGRDVVIDHRQRTVQLTETGEERLGELAQAYSGVWHQRRYRQELVRQALTAQYLLHGDTHYLVRNNKVIIIDDHTGRVMPERSWEHGLHQLVETKEGCPLTGRYTPLARISYQRFFRRYLRLAGMTGTAREVRGELWSVYRLGVVAIPTHRPVQRHWAGERVYRTAAAKWQAVVARVTDLHRQGRPVLIGTRSVAASEHLSHLLTAVGLPHQVLNARQDQEESTIIAEAGKQGGITVATNMAGRGTDIRLAPGVRERGGLHVIATERHEARRIDRQLFGRCGRQGDPGSYEMIGSLDDEVVTVYGAGLWRCPVVSAVCRHRWFASWLGRCMTRQAQRRAERLHARIRGDLLKMDDHLASALAFSGRPE